MDHPHQTRACSLEQDILWAVLDQDAVPHILNMARTNWAADPATAWSALQCQAGLGRLLAYRRTGPYVPVDLTRVTFEEASQDGALFLEPTNMTRERLGEIAAAVLGA